ncbi:hypothetical protein SFRURICE_019179, partial [Spodoptera frugiperda]
SKYLYSCKILLSNHYVPTHLSNLIPLLFFFNKRLDDTSRTSHAHDDNSHGGLSGPILLIDVKFISPSPFEPAAGRDIGRC